MGDRIKDTLQSLYQLMVQTTTPEPTGRSTPGHAGRDVLANELRSLSETLAAVKATATAKADNLPSVPGDLIQYIEDGRNPDIYTREFVELVRRYNQIMKGKYLAFSNFRDVLAAQMAAALPELKEDIDGVVEGTGGVPPGNGSAAGQKLADWSSGHQLASRCGISTLSPSLCQYQTVQLRGGSGVPPSSDPPPNDNPASKNGPPFNKQLKDDPQPGPANRPNPLDVPPTEAQTKAAVAKSRAENKARQKTPEEKEAEQKAQEQDEQELPPLTIAELEKEAAKVQAEDAARRKSEEKHRAALECQLADINAQIAQRKNEERAKQKAQKRSPLILTGLQQDYAALGNEIEAQKQAQQDTQQRYAELGNAIRSQEQMQELAHQKLQHELQEESGLTLSDLQQLHEALRARIRIKQGQSPQQAQQQTQERRSPLIVSELDRLLAVYRASLGLRRRNFPHALEEMDSVLAALELEIVARPRAPQQRHDEKDQPNSHTEDHNPAPGNGAQQEAGPQPWNRRIKKRARKVWNGIKNMFTSQSPISGI